MTLKGYLSSLRRISVPASPAPVERTCAHLIASLAREASLIEGEDGQGSGTLALRLERPGADAPEASFRISPEGHALLSATYGSLLYAAATLLLEEWAERPAAGFAPGLRVRPPLHWLRNLSDFLVGSLRLARGFDREGYLRQLARQGFTHVTVNGLGTELPFETSPPGDVYYWFYDYSPDLDQFVDSTLLKGYYPAEYLRKNLEFLRENVRLARTYGLAPGLHINSPRSMPEAFWERFGFLRGARIDHPRETLRPRYTLAMAHPEVQRHYRELMRNIMREVPDLAFVHAWTNDSGSGFEFTSSLYAGRNGGPYLIREWKSDREIARKAAENVVGYYRLLRDEGRSVNPRFRVIADIGGFMSERDFIIPALGDGIDVGDFAYFESTATEGQRQALDATGARTHVKTEIGDNNVLGVPYPSLVYERLSVASRSTAPLVLTGGTPGSLAPFDINGEVVRAFQLRPDIDLHALLAERAAAWAGREHAGPLLKAWQLSDRAVRSFPPGVPMSTFGFPWFRLWVRPFVPDIDAIPEEERAYYEQYLLATFNNPARVDLNNDMLWNFLTVSEAGGKKSIMDESVLPPLAEAIAVCGEALADARAGSTAAAVFDDLHARLRAGRCFCSTMRNTLAWTEAVHGYLQAKGAEEKAAFRAKCRAMVDCETANARELLDLCRSSRAEVIPVWQEGETLHLYGSNFARLLERKIALMVRHADDEPRVDPGYMWRMPPGWEQK
jgi:hypothetical protein